jgi:hypothetical protein
VPSSGRWKLCLAFLSTSQASCKVALPKAENNLKPPQHHPRDRAPALVP